MKTQKLLSGLLLALLLQVAVVERSSGQVAILLLLFGDDLATEDLHLSLDAGLNFSGMSNMEPGKMAYGVNFGLGLHAKLNDHWQLNPQIRPLSQKGSRNINPLIPLPVEFTSDKTILKFNYFEVPLMVRYNLTPELFIAAGPQIGFRVSSRQISTGHYSNGSESDLTIWLDQYLHKVDYSFPAEIGYRFRFSTKYTSSRITMDMFARYCPGLRNVVKDNVNHDDSYFSTFQFGLSFPFIKDEN